MTAPDPQIIGPQAARIPSRMRAKVISTQTKNPSTMKPSHRMTRKTARATANGDLDSGRRAAAFAWIHEFQDVTSRMFEVTISCRRKRVLVVPPLCLTSRPGEFPRAHWHPEVLCHHPRKIQDSRFRWLRACSRIFPQGRITRAQPTQDDPPLGIVEDEYTYIHRITQKRKNSSWLCRSKRAIADRSLM